MIIFPYPASKKHVKNFEKDLKLFFKKFIKIFFYADLIIVIITSAALTIFVEELKTSSILELVGLIIGMQFQLIIPIVLISLFISIISKYYLSKSKS